MKAVFYKLIEFNQKYGHVTRLSPTAKIDGNLVVLRQKLMLEEVNEYAFGAVLKDETVPERAKELADILYVWAGTVVAEGLQDYMEAIFNEVHKSNMSKGTLKDPTGKTMKGPDYKEPDLSFLNEFK